MSCKPIPPKQFTERSRTEHSDGQVLSIGLWDCGLYDEWALADMSGPTGTITTIDGLFMFNTETGELI